MTYKTIFGEMVEGDIISRRSNVIIVESADRRRHMIHKSDIGEHDTWANGNGFNLAECQRKGRTGRIVEGRHF